MRTWITLMIGAVGFGLLLIAVCELRFRPIWRTGKTAAKRDQSGRESRIDDMVVQTYARTAPVAKRRISGDPSYGCEVRWEAELFADKHFTRQFKNFQAGRVSK